MCKRVSHTTRQGSQSVEEQTAAVPRDAAPRGPRGRQAELYVRDRDLPRLIPLEAKDLKIADAAAHARLVRKLRRALRAERQRGEAGHWTYDLARHAGLLRAYRLEVATLAERLRRSSPPQK